MVDENRQLIPYVHTGQIVRRAGDLRLVLRVDTQGINAAMARLRAAMVGVALPAVRLPEERDVIDQCGVEQ